MKNQLLLIIGPPQSGKAWLATAITERHLQLREKFRIWKEPDLNNMDTLLAIAECVEKFGHAIVTCNLVTHEQLMKLAPDRVYSIGLRVIR